ncbi:MAG: hypothetical protein IPO88_11195 [Nannocystis sp.]|nr:hypothetical protein [Nannocystis sp.]
MKCAAFVGQLAAAIGRKMPDTLGPVPAADPSRTLLRARFTWVTMIAVDG